MTGRVSLSRCFVEDRPVHFISDAGDVALRQRPAVSPTPHIAYGDLAPPRPTPLYADAVTGRGVERRFEPSLLIQLVDIDPYRREQRRQELVAQQVTVVALDNADDVGELFRHTTPDAVVVCASDLTFASRLVPAVRVPIVQADQVVPIIVWTPELESPERRARVIDVGADAVLDQRAGAADIVDCVRALKRISEKTAHWVEQAGSAALLESTSVALALLDDAGRVSHLNRAFVELWQTVTGTRPRLVGESFVELFIPGERPMIREILATLMAAAPYAQRTLAVHLGHSRLTSLAVDLEIARAPEETPHARLVVQMRDLRTATHGVSPARSLDALLPNGSVAWELPTPAMHSTVLSDLLHNGRLSGAVAESADIDPEQFPILDLRALVNEHCATFARVLPRALALHADVGGEDALVRGHDTELQQALTCLLLNARDAQPLGGQITVMVRVFGQVVAISIADDGPGVPADQREWIFQPLATTRAHEGAAGMGLPTARAIVERHGGMLELDPSAPQGARFLIVLPRYVATSWQPPTW